MAVSYATQIRPLFRDVDIDHMSFFCDLSKYEDVKTNCQEILTRLKASGAQMMPPKRSGGPWSPGNITLFQQWIDDGCQP